MANLSDKIAPTGILTPSSSIKDLSDVSSGMTPTDGQVLTYDTTNGWQAETAVTSLADLGVTATADNLNATQFLSGRNKIINGAMAIDQRSAGAAATVNGNYASADRWKAGNNTNTGTIQQIASTLSGYRNSIKYTASGSGTFFQLGQQIEFASCYDLQNQTVTISFRAKANNSNSGSTALIVRTRTVPGIDGAAIFAGTNVDTSITLTTSDAFYTVTRTLPATFGALSVEFVLGSHVSGDGFEITGVQLEAGDVATPFEVRSIGQELALCQRYYQKGALVERHHGGSPVQYLASVRYGIPLRASPTRTVQNNGSVDVNAATFATYGNESQLEIGVDTTSSSAYINCNWTADAEL